MSFKRSPFSAGSFVKKRKSERKRCNPIKDIIILLLVELAFLLFVIFHYFIRKIVKYKFWFACFFLGLPFCYFISSFLSWEMIIFWLAILSLPLAILPIIDRDFFLKMEEE